MKNNKDIKMVKVAALVVIMAVAISFLVIFVLGDNGTDTTETPANIDVDTTENQEEQGEGTSAGQAVDGAPSGDINASGYVANCVLLSAGKLDTYPNYEEAVQDITNSINEMSAYQVPAGLEDFHQLTLDAWGEVLAFAETQDGKASFDRNAPEIQDAVQLFRAASEQVDPSLLSALTDESCIVAL